MKRNTNAKTKSENKPEKIKAWRFYRSNLPSKVWGGDEVGVIADFSKGHFTTEDKKLAIMLKQKGYVEIDLDATAPPNIIVSPPTQVLKEGANIPIMTPGINQNIAEQQMKNITEEVVAPPEVI